MTLVNVLAKAGKAWVTFVLWGPIEIELIPKNCCLVLGKLDWVFLL